MKLCDCGRISMFLKTERRGNFAVDYFECGGCGVWEDYRIIKTHVLTLADVQERLSRLRQYNNERYHEIKHDRAFRQRLMGYRARAYMRLKLRRLNARMGIGAEADEEDSYESR
jgi:hypothetical protein